MTAVKPLGRPAYGSIPHLPGSRRGPGDHGISEGQARICTERARPEDTVEVTVKLDGSCVAAARIGDTIVPLIRAGYHARDSPHYQHHAWSHWCAARGNRFRRILADGERIVGEWLLQAHGTRYTIPHEDDLFAAFDIFTETNTRMLLWEVISRVQGNGIRLVPLISASPPIAVEEAMKRARTLGRTDGAWQGEGEVEGVVYRVVRHGAVEFLAKHVRPDHTPGQYLTGPEVWNWPVLERSERA